MMYPDEVNPSQPQRCYSIEDYFSLEAGSTVRHEFFNGEIFAMAGGTVAHNQIAGNVLGDLRTGLKGRPCRALGSDMRLLTPGGLLTYPDVMVICGPVELAHGREDLVTNPVLLVEVLSDATRAYDLGEKFDLYKPIATLHEYLVIEQRTVGVQAFRRAASSWEVTTCDRLDDTVSLSSIHVRLALADVYEKVFDQPQ
jgi:Uma2 family endonuclease